MTLATKVQLGWVLYLELPFPDQLFPVQIPLSSGQMVANYRRKVTFVDCV